MVYMDSPQFDILENKGLDNTQETINNAYNNSKILQLKTLIVASTTGSTIKQILNKFDPTVYKIICVTHNYYFKEKVAQSFPDSLKEELKLKGVLFVQGTLAFSGVESALMRKFQHLNPISLFSKLTRLIIGDGVKVAMEMALMSVDAGHIAHGEDVLTISGTGHWADPVGWLQAASSRYIEKLRVKAILMKPLWKNE